MTLLFEKRLLPRCTGELQCGALRLEINIVKTIGPMVNAVINRGNLVSISHSCGESYGTKWEVLQSRTCIIICWILHIQGSPDCSRTRWAEEGADDSKNRSMSRNSGFLSEWRRISPSHTPPLRELAKHSLVSILGIFLGKINNSARSIDPCASTESLV